MEKSQTVPKPFVFPVMKKAIEDLFTKPHITKDDIQAFQDKYWEQLVPKFSQALKLLDIHGVPRHNILWSINDRLMDAIKARVDSKSDDQDQKKCQKLWQKLIKTGMAYIHHPYMRSLIMQVLGKMNSIKERHVNLIVDNKYLYDDAPLPVLRHIWVAHPRKFQEELDKVIATFQASWNNAILDALTMSITSTSSSTADLVPILYWPPRRRRRDPSIVRIVEMIGEGQVLYDKTVTILRDECMKFEKAAAILIEQQCKTSMTPNSTTTDTSSPAKKRKHHSNSGTGKDASGDSQSSNPIPTAPFIPLAFLPNQPAIASSTLCTLRFDLLMSLNEAKVDRLCVPDRIHRFVWCLDACVRNRRIDQRHANELAYHLQLQRRKWARRTCTTDQHVQNNDNPDSHQHHDDMDEDDDPDCTTGELAHRRIQSGTKSKTLSKSSSTFSKSGQKRTMADRNAGNQEDDEEEERDAKSLHHFLETNLLEIDIHMACRDPWVVYTICTSLIRYVIHGVYEYKLPRDIPEVNLLVHLLVLGLGNDVTPFNVKIPNTKDHAGLKRCLVGQSSSSSSSVASDSTDSSIPKCPARALIGYVLPAIAQLQVLVWRAQIAEEILAASCSLWPNQDPTSSTQETRDSSGQSELWQKRIKDASMSTNVSVPPGYLIHPIGYLMLQYHCLFALERNEFAVLRALLKAAVTAAQSRPGRPGSKLSSSTCTNLTSKLRPDSPPCTNNLSGPSVTFRWRPEVLQALVLGIARLPVSAPAYVDTTRNVHGTSGPAESGLNDGTGQTELENNTSTNPTLNRSNSVISSVISGSDLGSSTSGLIGPKSSSTGGISSSSTSSLSSSNNAELHATNNGPTVTRAGLASLLRSSLPLINDVQLLALAQIALLVPGPTPTSTSTSSTSLATNPSADLNLESSSNLSERERLVNTLARHCTPLPIGSAEGTTNTTTTTSSNDPNGNSTGPNLTGGCYKSSNPRVLSALESVRKDIERCLGLATTPLTPTNRSKSTTATPFAAFSSQLSTGSATSNFNAFQAPDIWVAPSPRSPVASSKYPRDLSRTPSCPASASSSSSSSLAPPPYPPNRFDPKGFPSSSFYPSGFGPHLPIGTPLTNPGLMAPTPNLGNLNVGQTAMLTPRRPSTPPLGSEFLPTSPSVTTSLTGFGIPTQQRNTFNFDSLTSCPSPAAHRSGAGSSSFFDYQPPRTPSPPPSQAPSTPSSSSGAQITK